MPFLPYTPRAKTGHLRTLAQIKRDALVNRARSRAIVAVGLTEERLLTARHILNRQINPHKYINGG